MWVDPHDIQMAAARKIGCTELDAVGRLTEVSAADGKSLARYGYDHRGLRNLKAAGGQTWRYLYSEDRQLLAELNEAGQVTRQYLYLGDQPLALIDTPDGRALAPEGNGLGQILRDLGQALASWTNDPGLVWLHADHLGAPVAASNGHGQVIWRASYSPFGRASVATADGFNLNLRLPGQYRDEETGFYYNRARYYDPEQGRYLSPDPLGTPDGPNPYAYAAYNPLRYIDPDGLVLFAFDGTGNDESDPDTISNVVKFRDMYNSDGKKNFYITGPGTRDPRSGIC